MTLPTIQYNLDSKVFQEYCMRVFAYLKPECTSLTIKNYQNNFGERADHTLLFNSSYEEALESSIKKLKEYQPDSKDCNGFKLFDLKEAKEKLLSQWTESLSKDQNHFFTNSESYVDVYDNNGAIIPGIAFHKHQKVLHIKGWLIEKKLLSKGYYPRKNRSRKYEAEKFLTDKVPLAKWRQYKLMLGRFDELIIKNFTIKGK